jgi:hypothetical protein
MQAMASALETEIETRDAKQVIDLSRGKITFHPDDRGFAFITAKGAEVKTIKLIEEIRGTIQE